MQTPSEFSKLLKDRAEAATRVLERRRISLETAIEALEVVGYKVYQGNDGVYDVQPPRDRASEYDAFPTVEPTPEAKGAFLSDYPAILTIKDVGKRSCGRNTASHWRRISTAFVKPIRIARALLSLSTSRF